ncbi:MAG: four helix bundle protein [Flavobacteriaceae bacterium]
MEKITQNTYRKLVVWQKSMDLVTTLYIELKNFPPEELYTLTSQIKRAAISIPSNIAEGYGRSSNKEYQRFLNISLSSLFELQTQLEISKNLTYLDSEKFDRLYENTREVERMLSSLIRKISS